MNDSIYLDIDLYNYYSILYKNRKIIGVTDNILDCNYIIGKYDIDYFHNIQSEDLENNKVLNNLPKLNNNNSFDLIKLDSISISNNTYVVI